MKFATRVYFWFLFKHLLIFSQLISSSSMAIAICILPFVLVRSIHIDPLEDDVDYGEPSNEVDYDWSPPNLPEEDWDVESELEKRGFQIPKKKKNQVLCRVQRSVHRHADLTHEYFPKSYTSYSCVPVTSRDNVDITAISSHETCYVSGPKCITIEKEQLFLKRRHKTNCWTHFIEAVGAGCKCFGKKYLE